MGEPRPGSFVRAWINLTCGASVRYAIMDWQCIRGLLLWPLSPPWQALRRPVQLWRHQWQVTLPPDLYATSQCFPTSTQSTTSSGAVLRLFFGVHSDTSDCPCSITIVVTRRASYTVYRSVSNEKYNILWLRGLVPVAGCRSAGRRSAFARRPSRQSTPDPPIRAINSETTEMLNLKLNLWRVK